MKKVWVFRHGPKESGAGKNVICPEMGLKNPEGYEMTKKIVETLLEEQKFNALFTSPFVRAYQTGVIFALELGMPLPSIIDGLAGKNLCQDWVDIILTLTGSSCADLYHAAPQLLQQEGEQVFETIQLIAESLEDDSQDLCVSHGGLIEPAMAAAKTRFVSDFETELLSIQDLKEGDGVIFEFDENNNFIGLEEKRLYNPILCFY